MPFQHEFKVANPSSYPRDDYVEVDLETLDVPASLDEKSLKLSRVTEHRRLEEIPFQVDSVLGAGARKRVLTFLSKATPPGADDYTGGTATFVLEEGTPKDFSSARTRDLLWVAHYYEEPEPGEPADGSNRAWHPGRKVYGVQLFSDVLEVYFSLVPHPRLPTATNLAGAATSVVHRRVKELMTKGDVLSPFWGSLDDRARWGQLTHLAFYPLPWERRWYHKKSLIRAEERDRQYELVWSHSGPIRSVVTLKSEALTIRFEGRPYFAPDSVDLKCHLYRVISSYPGKEYYVEELYVRTESGLTLAFRAYFNSFVNCGAGVAAELSRFEHLPDFFAVWRHFGPAHYGYGFASDTHVRDVRLSGDEISWRLQLGHDRKCLHYFMLNSFASPPLDPFKEIGHFGWYENILKPLRALPIVSDLPHDAWDETD